MNEDKIKTIDEQNEIVANIDKLKKLCITPLYSLDEIFSQQWFFRIPTYQRGYVWETRESYERDKIEDKQLDKFWKDIINCDQSRNHYTGQLVLQKMNTTEVISEKLNEVMSRLDGEKYGFYVVDGQQRLTTSLILISVLFNKLQQEYPDEYKSNTYLKLAGELRLSYQSQENYDSMLKFILTGEDYSSAETTKESIYFEKTFKAKEFFEEKVNTLNEIELKNIYQILLNNINFNILFVNNDNIKSKKLLDSEELFESINNRGKALTKLEILKNRCFFVYKSNQNIVDENKAPILNVNELTSSWATIYHNLGLAAKYNTLNNCLGDDEFLRAHWIMYKDNYSKDSNEYIFDTQILEQFEGEMDDAKCTNIINYIKTLRDFSMCWKYLHNSISIPEKTQKRDDIIKILSSLNRIEKDIYLTSFIVCLIYKSLSQNIIDSIDLITVLSFLEKYIFSAKYIAKKREFSFLISHANNIYKSDKANILQNVQEVIGELIGQNPKQDKSLINVLSKETLTNWIEYYSYGSKYSLYAWNGLSYFLYALNSEVNNDIDGIDFISLVENKQKTIEHIFPQKSKSSKLEDVDRKYWEEAVNKHLTAVNAEKYVINALGNFLPLSKSTNTQVSNKMYPKKIGAIGETVNKTYYKGSSLAKRMIESQDLEEVGNYKCKYKHWTINSIIERTLKLLEKIETSWFDFSNIKLSNGFKTNSNLKFTFSEKDKVKAINFNNENNWTLKSRHNVDVKKIDELTKTLEKTSEN